MTTKDSSVKDVAFKLVWGSAAVATRAIDGIAVYAIVK